MLRLSSDVLSAASERRMTDFDLRMTRVLTERYGTPDRPIKAHDLLPHVTHARRQARAIGMVTEQQIFDLVEAYVTNGDALWQDPTFLRIARSRLRSPEDKARAIRDRFVRRSTAA